VLRPHVDAALSTVVVDRDNVRHSGIRVPAGAAFLWKMPAAARGRLRFGWSAKTSGPVALRVDINGKGQEFARQFTNGGTGNDFFDEDAPIDAQAPVALRFASSVSAEIVISDLRVVVPSDSNDAVILIVFDTLRRDAVGLYGSARPTTPSLDRILGDGWKAERAYTLASWTIPSCATLLTGMVPEVHEDDSGTPIGIAKDVPTIASDFARAGWSTAQFNANPTLNADNGFDAGFTAFYTPPYEISSLKLPGSDTLKRVPEWIRAHEGEKFLLYIQLIDPHEPWGPPDRPRGQTPFDPDYRGKYMGDESQYSLMFDKSITQRDGEHLRALYDDDVRFADMLIGRFWNGLDPSLRRRSTVVFASDHGEEFHEHDGWDHGPALYSEVVQVPLVIRSGNGRRQLPAPPGTLVSLADVLPTVEHMLAIAGTRTVNGVDLNDRKNWDRSSLPAIHMLTGGAARAVVVRKNEKLFFFDRYGTKGIPDAKSDPNGHAIALLLPDITPSLCSFDLASDPGEKRQLSPATAGEGADWRSIEQSIAHTRRGVEVRVLGGPAAAHLRFTVRTPSTETQEFADEPDDHVTTRGQTTSFDLELTAGDVDGAMLKAPDDAGVEVALEAGCARLNGEPIKIGVAVSLTKVSRTIPRLETDPRCASIYIWRSTGAQYFRTQKEADEATKKLRSIGYVH